MPYCVPFGDGNLSFDLPSTWDLVDVVEQFQTAQPLTADDIRAQLEAFAHHIAEIVDMRRPLVAIFTDATRASPDQTLLEPIIRILQPTGVSIKLLCAIGMHRRSTDAEKRAKLGDWLVGNFEVVDHDPTTVLSLGMINGVPIEINPLLLDATIITVGVVEPHQYAGYSGGTKTAVIGCGGPGTIAHTHSPAFLNLPGTRLGAVEGNPFQRFLQAAGAKIGHEYAINVVLDNDGEILHLATGAPDDVHDKLVKQARCLYECPVPNAPYDVVIAGVGAPKDANLYQASRAATYIGLSAHPVIRDGGVILVPAPLPEKGGQGQGEQNTLDLLRRFGPTPDLISHLLTNDSRPGEQRAFMIAQLQQRYRMVLVGVQKPGFLKDTGLLHAPDMPTAVAMTEILLGTSTPSALIVPHALKTLPVSTMS